MTNKERALKLIEARRHLPAAGIVEGLAAAGLLAPDPPPRYKVMPAANRSDARDEQIVKGPLIVCYWTIHATPDERAAVLAALNAMQEEA